jgi:DNA primase
MARASAPVTWNVLKNLVEMEELCSSLNLSVSGSQSEATMPCPLPSHQGADTNPSFSINLEKKVFNCFACGQGGSMPTLVMELEGLEYQDAIKYILQFAPGALTGDGEEDDEFAANIREILFWDEVEQDELEFPRFHPRVLEPWQNYPISEFIDMGISEATQRFFQLGIDREHYRRLKNGDEYVGRALIIPHFFEGSLVGYQSRWLDEDRPKKVPKYTNTRNFPKAETLYGYDQARESADSTVYIFEGSKSVHQMRDLGYSAVATFGAEVSDLQLELLTDFDHIATAYDDDSEGLKATNRIVQELKDTVVVYVVEPVGIPKANVADLPPAEAHAHLQWKVSTAYNWLRAQ